MASAPGLPSRAGNGAEALIEARFTACADRLKLIRGSVHAAARMCGFGETIAENIVLAVDEACQNVIVHAYEGQDGGDIVLGLFRDPDGLLVHVSDYAPRVDPEQIKPRDLNDLRPGKLGSHYMREIMDTVTLYPANGGGNLLEMRKRLDDPS